MRKGGDVAVVRSFDFLVDFLAGHQEKDRKREEREIIAKRVGGA